MATDDGRPDANDDDPVYEHRGVPITIVAPGMTVRGLRELEESIAWYAWKGMRPDDIRHMLPWALGRAAELRGMDGRQAETLVAVQQRAIEAILRGHDAAGVA